MATGLLGETRKRDPALEGADRLLARDKSILTLAGVSGQTGRHLRLARMDDSVAGMIEQLKLNYE